MGAYGGLALILFVTFLPWGLWLFLRSLWLRRREREVLRAKYGDLEMFSKRLKEWGVTRER